MRRAAGEEAGRPRRGRHAVLRFQRRRASDGGRAKEGGRRRAGGEGGRAAKGEVGRASPRALGRRPRRRRLQGGDPTRLLWLGRAREARRRAFHVRVTGRKHAEPSPSPPAVVLPSLVCCNLSLALSLPRLRENNLRQAVSDNITRRTCTPCVTASEHSPTHKCTQAHAQIARVS